MTKKAFLLFVCVGLALFSLTGCDSTKASAPTLAELLREYTVPSEEFWGDDSNRGTEITYVYHLDPLYFEDFRTELEAGGGYILSHSEYNTDRDWDKGLTFARLAIRPDGTFELDICKEKDHYEFKSRYKKAH